MRLLMSTLENIPDGRKVIVWTTYVHGVRMIYDAIVKAYGAESVLTCYGTQKGFQQVELFKDPKKWVLVANPTKAGVGLNIQFSNYQIFFNNSYSYVKKEQCEGRQHRQGQKDSVTVFELISKCTVDEIVLGSVRDKKNLSISLSALAKVIKKQL